MYENNTICTKFSSAVAKSNHQFGTMHGLQPAPVSCGTSTLIDNVLASFPSTYSQKGLWFV